MKKFMVLAMGLVVLGGFVRAEEAASVDLDCEKTSKEVERLIPEIDSIRDESDKAWGPNCHMKEGYAIIQRLQKIENAKDIKSKFKKSDYDTRKKIADVFRGEGNGYSLSAETLGGINVIIRKLKIVSRI
jgi:hypothetical protein